MKKKKKKIERRKRKGEQDSMSSFSHDADKCRLSQTGWVFLEFFHFIYLFILTSPIS